MSANRSIELAIERAERLRDETASRLTQMVQSKRNAEDQLRQLQDYSLETENRLLTRSGGRISVEVLQHHHQFVIRLQEANRIQTEVLRNLEIKLTSMRFELATAESTLLGLRKFLRHRLKAKALRDERKTQHALDDLALQQYLRRAHSEWEGGW